jgi:hypothetical protein
LIHGLIEGRICHYLPLEATSTPCGWAALLVKVVNKQSATVNLNAVNPDTGEVVFRENVPFIPKAKNVRGSWHYVERVD